MNRCFFARNMLINSGSLITEVSTAFSYEMAEDVLPDVHEKNMMYDQAENHM
jgi:hypothetical protein